MTTISLRLNDDDGALFRNYAKLHDITLTELIRMSVLEHIENEYDLKSYKAAMKEHLENPNTYSLDDIEKELGII